MESAIETIGLGKDYSKFTAVHELDLVVPRGTVFGFLGPNGAGKTTTIMMLLGNIRPSRGKAMLLGKPIGDRETRRKVGFLPEKFQFHEFLTAMEFLHLHGKLAGMSHDERNRRVPEVLERVGLGPRKNSRIREFSKGMQQRIGLAQAILNHPDIVILDEPTSALDPLGRRDVRDIVMELRAQGKTVLLNSHLLSEIEMTCDRVAIIKKGRVATQGTMDELLSYSSTVEVEVRDLNDAALAAVRQITAKLKIERVPITRFTAWIKSEDDLPELARALVENGVKLMALIPRRETLEELFVRIIESDSP
jgi:ABC-2 type transport system ATP-binding protein